MLSDENDARDLRLGVFGWVQDGFGSVASAHYQLCRALLAAGHHIDFFANPAFIPNPGYESPRFEYVPIDVSLRHVIDPDVVPLGLRELVVRLRGRRETIRYREHGMIVARSRHLARPYDALLFLGTPPGSTIEGITTVVWPQGAPRNELDAIRGLAKPIRRISGRAAYLKVRLYYEIKDRLVWRWVHRHRLVLASQFARDKALRFGVNEDRIVVAPYPIDLDKFSPGPMPSDSTRRILCVGRLDPRKRVDLLVDAVALLAKERDDFHLEVVGKDGYVSGWSAFVQRAGLTLPITYSPPVPQHEILARLRAADVVVQPSQHEEFGSAVAEALACGVPVVTGPSNGTSQYLPTFGSARFDHYDPVSLVDALQRALALSRDPAARASNRAAALAFAAERAADTIGEFIRRSTSSTAPPHQLATAIETR